MSLSNKKGKLTVDDVVQIKRHLLFKNLKQKEIALKFGVVPSVISKIKNEQRFSEVKIDDNGEYIEPVVKEILPENYHVPTIKEPPKDKVEIDDESTQYRLNFVESYFKRKVGTDSYDEKATSTHYEPVAKISRRYIFAIWNSKKWLFNFEWDDFISQIMSIVTVATFKYESDFNFKWEQVETAGTKENKSLHSYINRAIEHELNDYANKINDVMQVQQDGVIGYAKPIKESIDKKNETEEGTFEIIEELSDSFFQMKDEYTGSHFLDWFTQHKDELLTNEQNKYLNVMTFYQRDKNDDYTIPYRDIPDKYKPYSESSRDHHRRRIIERVDEAYSKVEPIPLRKMSHQKEYDFWTSFIKFVWLDDERIDEQNRLLTNWIKQRMSNSYMSNLLFNMPCDVVVALNKAGSEIDSKALYQIVECVESRMEQLVKLINKVVPFIGKAETVDTKKLNNEQIIQRMKAEGKSYVNMRVLPSGVIEIID